MSLYLDFDGDFRSRWGSYSDITTPAYCQDGDPTTFTDAELASIEQVWRYVAEDYSPYDINVTTVQPASMAAGTTMHVVVGGNGGWTGGAYGGMAYVGSFISSPNTAFVFSANLGNGNPRYTGEASSHEAGHGFGLRHQSLYDASGGLVATYYQGPGDGRAPILGNSYYATRGLWWYGTTTSATTYQDDMAVIAGARNGFGYRPDDVGDDDAHASPLTVAGTQLSGSGIIATTADEDWFSFQTDEGQVTLNVGVPSGVNDLDARLELRDAAGNLVASIDPSSSFGATITATVPGGTYDLVVASHGGYGDVGQYTVSGTVAPPVIAVAAPGKLSAAAVSSSQINLAWTDNASNESGYAVYRSTDGLNWSVLAGNLPASSTAYSDTGVAPGGTYYYQVRAFSAATSSDFSNQAAATLAPAAPGSLTATAVSSKRIDLSWNDVAGETAYQVECSLDGQNWSQIGTAGANVTTYANAGLTASTTYYYRLLATNAGGNSPCSVVVAATTPASAVPDAPWDLLVRATSEETVVLTWTDNSNNEDGFIIERSADLGGSWIEVGRTGFDATTYTDATFDPQTRNWYRVRSFSDAGISDPSNLAAGTICSWNEGLFFGASQTTSLGESNAGAAFSDSTPKAHSRCVRGIDAALADRDWVDGLRRGAGHALA